MLTKLILFDITNRSKKIVESFSLYPNLIIWIDITMELKKSWKVLIYLYIWWSGILFYTPASLACHGQGTN